MFGFFIQNISLLCFCIQALRQRRNEVTVELRKVCSTLKDELYITLSVFSPGRSLAGFPQEKLRWCIKSQEDAPVWAQRQAACQMDLRVGTLE